MLNEWDKALHDAIHTSMLDEDPGTLLNEGRLDILDKLKKKDLKIEGIIADVGCGSGYLGIGLAKRFPNLLRIDCIEASKLAVEKVIPRNIKFHNVEKIVKPIHGSFDNLGSEKYDFIFAMGALHHSRDLNKTLRSVGTALKSNGILIAQEPTMPDNTTHADYQFKYNIVEERFGIKIRNGDRFDRFFRECEYKYFLIINGFDILLWEDYELKVYKRSILTRLKSLKNYLTINGYKKTFIKVINSLKKKPGPKTWKTDMQKAVANVKPKLIIAKKSALKEIFHEINL
jgi:SAM-dependent methyltransferase